MTCSPPPLFLLLLLLLLLPPLPLALLCYSCSGTCHAGAPCNCQMGSCEADFCFAEKEPSEVPGMVRITKGCVKRPQRTRPGCDFAHFADHLQCICGGADFCNDAILMRVHTTRRNVTCRSCPESRPDCGQTCQGQWCHLRVSTSASGCGFGPPALPYLYQTPELFRHRNRVCLSMSRGIGHAQQLCVCNTPLCNDPEAFSAFPADHQHPLQQAISPFAALLRSLGASGGGQRSRSLAPAVAAPPQSPPLPSPPLFDCVSCELNSAVDAAMTSNCRQNRCRGHFCVYATQRVFVAGSFQSLGWSDGPSGAAGPGSTPQAVLHESQGCINTSAAAIGMVQLGCAHKWVANEREQIFCACRGHLCNTDLATASASGAMQQPLTTALTVIFLLLTVINGQIWPQKRIE